MHSPHDAYLRFEWSLPQSRGKLLFKQIMEHEWSSNGTIFAMKVPDLELGQVFQLQASREQLKSHPEMDAVETWATIRRLGYGKPPYTMVGGTSLRSKTSLLAKLDVSHVPCESGRNPLQSFAWNMFHNDGVIVFCDPITSWYVTLSLAATVAPVCAVTAPHR